MDSNTQWSLHFVHMPFCMIVLICRFVFGNVAGRLLVNNISRDPAISLYLSPLIYKYYG